MKVTNYFSRKRSWRWREHAESRSRRWWNEPCERPRSDSASRDSSSSAFLLLRRARLRVWCWSWDKFSVLVTLPAAWALNWYLENLLRESSFHHIWEPPPTVCWSQRDRFRDLRNRAHVALPSNLFRFYFFGSYMINHVFSQEIGRLWNSEYEDRQSCSKPRTSQRFSITNRNRTKVGADFEYELSHDNFLFEAMYYVGDELMGWRSAVAASILYAAIT